VEGIQPLFGGTLPRAGSPSVIPMSDTSTTDTDVYVSPSRVPALIALLLAVVGGAGMAWNFVYGVNAALDSGGNGAGLFIVLFLVSAALVLAALVTSIVCLVRGKARGIAGLALVVSLLPIVGVIVLRIAAMS
jgi:hypothetical protein